MALGAPASGAAQLDEAVMEGVGEADLDWRLRTLDGARVTLADYHGEVLVVNMWATWCTPCVRELASFVRLRDALGDAPVRFLFVSPEDLGHVRRFHRRYRYDLPLLVEDQPMPAAFDLRALPTTYVIDPAGRIVLRHRGAAEWDTEPVRRLLAHLASQPSPGR
jgi:peroxiredoxin